MPYRIFEKVLNFLAPATAGGTAASPVTGQVVPGPEKPQHRPSVPVYPPHDLGLEFHPPEEVLATQAPLIKRLRLAAGVPDAEYEALFGEVVRNLAGYINLLPASETDTHTGAGGLFRLALEVGFFALQASEATIFAARAGVEKRRDLEPRWRYAAFLAGICCELHRPITQMIVTAPNGAQWPPYQIGLGQWLAEQGTDRYFIRWLKSNATPRSGQGAASYVAHKIIPSASMQYLHDADNSIGAAMIDVITGNAGPLNSTPLGKVIATVRQKVLERDRAIQPKNYGHLTVGAHLEPHLLDAMRRLAESGAWTINAKKSRLWFGTEGLFLVWRTAAKEILEILEQDGVTGTPKDQQTLLDALVDAKVFVVDKDGSPYWTIYPPPKGNDLLAVRFANALTLLGSLPEMPASIGDITGPKATTNNQAVTQPATCDAPAVAEPTPKVEEPTGEPAPAAPSASTPPPVARPSQSVAPKKPKSGAPGEEQDVGSNVPGDVGKSLSPHLRDVVGALIEDLRAGAIRNEAGKVSDGFAISLEQFASYGIDVTSAIAELYKLGWLYTPPEKPEKKIQQIQINGRPQRAVILKLPVAIDLGLVL